MFGCCWKYDKWMNYLFVCTLLSSEVVMFVVFVMSLLQNVLLLGIVIWVVGRNLVVTMWFLLFMI